MLTAMINGRTVASFVKQHLITASVRHLSFASESALLTIRDAEVKSTLRNVVDVASGRNVVVTGSLQVTKFHIMQMFQLSSAPVITPPAQVVVYYGLSPSLAGGRHRISSRLDCMSSTICDQNVSIHVFQEFPFVFEI